MEIKFEGFFNRRRKAQFHENLPDLQGVLKT